MIPIANPDITEKDKQAVLKVLESGMLASGPEVKKFEEEFAAFVGADYGIATSSGTTALDTAVQICGLKAGDRVITTPFTFIASCNSLLFNSVKPVFADIDYTTFNLDPVKVREILEKDPEIKGMLPVHLFGQSANMTELMELAEEYNLIVIEDAAQAHGASHCGRRAGSFGQAGIFSFYPTKNMTTGEGGMLVTSDANTARRARKTINHGRAGDYQHEVLGYNFRSTDLAAALGRQQLSRLEDDNEKRRENARYLTDKLKELDWLEVPEERPENYHVYHQYTVRLRPLNLENHEKAQDYNELKNCFAKVERCRDQLVEHLKEWGVGCGIYYPLPAHKQPLYRKRGYDRYSCPRAETAASQVLSLPVHPALSQSDLEKIVKAVSCFSKKFLR